MSAYTFSHPDLMEKLYANLSSSQLQALRAAVAGARGAGAELYLVGGSVRDLLLDELPRDLDLTTDGDHLDVARRAASAVSATVKVYGRFGTTSVLAEGLRLDFAHLRGETYRRPGALPDVFVSDLAADLWRRDITINAIALGLCGAAEGKLVDPTAGVADLDKKLIRVIHDQSFVDDATRILRALRYAARFEFEIEAHTANLMRGLAPYLATISGARLRAELIALLSDRHPWLSLERAAQLGVLDALSPGLDWDARRSTLARAWVALPGPQRARRLLVLLASTLSPKQAEQFGEHLALGTRELQLARQAGDFAARSRAIAKLSRVEQGLLVRRYEHTVVMSLVDLFFAPAEARTLKDAYKTRSSLNGGDLLALGVPEGPVVGDLLDQILRARLAGTVRSRSDELALARTLIAAQTREDEGTG